MAQIALIGFPDPIASDIAAYLTHIGHTPLIDDESPSSTDCLLIGPRPLTSHAGILSQMPTVPRLIIGDPDSTLPSAWVQQAVTLVLPFSFHQLNVLIQSQLNATPTAEPLWNQWALQPTARQLCHPSQPVIELTDKEVALLQSLRAAAPDPVTKEQLLHHVWGYGPSIDTHTLETHIYRLRNKLEPTQPTNQPNCGIQTTENGYLFVEETSCLVPLCDGLDLR